VVGKHLYVLANPGFSCGIDPMETILNKIPTAEYLPWLFQADGLCQDARDTLLGLSIPQWSAAWFVLLTVALVSVLARRSR
jgi:disulfide bond formation protein DsbB